MKIYKIFIFGYYGFNNFGDELLLKSIVLNISRSIDAYYYVRSFNEGFISDKNINYTELDKIFLENSKLKYLKYFIYLTKYVTISNMVIFGGGTLIHDRISLSNNFVILYITILAKLLRKKVYFLGLGISDLNRSLSKIILKYLVKSSDLFCIRDKEAECVLMKSQVKNKYIVTEDLAYCLKNEFKKYDVLLKKDNGIRIGISVVDDDRYNDIFIDEILKYLQILKEENKNLTVYFFVFNEVRIGFKYDKSDLRVIEAITKKMQGFEVYTINCCIDDYESIYSKLDYIIGMRYHSLILSAIYGRPFIGIVHDNKIRGICKKYNMPWLDINELEYQSLYNKTLEIKGKKIIIDKLTLKKANENFKFLEDL